MGFLDRFNRPPTEGEFAKLVIKMMREVGDERHAIYDNAESRLVFTKDGKESGMLNLRNLFLEYCKAADRRERAALLRRSCLGFASQIEVPDDFEDVKPDLLPNIRPTSMIDVMRLDAEIQGLKWKDLAVVPLSDHLAVCLVYDLPTTMQFVTEDHLSKWGLSHYEAVEIAKRNLEDKEFSMASIGEKVFAFVAGDAFDATRLLLVDRIRSLNLNGQPVAMPINRDFLLVTGSEEIEGLGIMADFAEKKKEEPRPICPIPHTLIGDEWEPWLPPSEHPHHEAFRMLQLKYLFGEYAEQKTLLDRRHEQTGEDAFVASFKALERDEKVLSYCVWSKSVLAWLPKTEFVGLYNPEVKSHSFVAWDQLHAAVSHLMTPLDCHLPRWLVNEFPSPGQIEQMKTENWGE